MAKKAVVEGEVIMRDDNKTRVEFYEESFVLDDAVETLEQARQIIKKGLITDRFSKRPNFKRIRTCQVVSFENTNEKPESGEVDKLLIEATRLNCIPENLNIYEKPEHKAKALQKAVDGAKTRAKKKTVKENVEDLGYVD